MSKFRVEHTEEQVVLKFEPKPCGSSGRCRPSLCWAALKEISIENWSWDSENLMLYQLIDGELTSSDYANMVGAAQAEVTKIMEKLIDLEIAWQLLEEVK